MQILFHFVFIFCTIATAWTAVSIGYYGDPAHPGKCVFHGIVVAANEVYYDLEKCEQIICKENTWTTYNSCGVLKLPNDCRLGGPRNPYAPYPDCCERYILCNSI